MTHRVPGHTLLRCLVVVAIAGLPVSMSVRVAHAVPIAPGFTVTVHESVPDPIAQTFGPDGALYLGRDNAGSGGGGADAVFIHRVAPGGGSHVTYGVSAIPDPDEVFFDGSGIYSGVAGSVIVGGVHPSGTGLISAVRPDQSVVPLWGPGAGFVNPSDFAVDSAGRLLFTDFETAGLYRTTGGPPSVFFSPGAGNRDIEIQPTSGEIYLRNTAAGAIRVYSSSGVLQSTFASGIPGSGMAFGQGGAWGNALYVSSVTLLLRVNGAASRDTIATGFLNAVDLEFGPGGDLYVSDFGADKIYRLHPAETAVDDVQRSQAVRLWATGPQLSSTETFLRFALPNAGRAAVRVLDLAGREVAKLYDGVASAGEHDLRWDGRDKLGRGVPSGVYLVRLVAPEGAATSRVVRIR
jgi:hypothetical protein